MSQKVKHMFWWVLPFEISWVNPVLRLVACFLQLNLCLVTLGTPITLYSLGMAPSVVVQCCGPVPTVWLGEHFGVSRRTPIERDSATLVERSSLWDKPEDEALNLGVLVKGSETCHMSKWKATEVLRVGPGQQQPVGSDRQLPRAWNYNKGQSWASGDTFMP